MNIKTFLQKNWIHLASIAFMFILTSIYFSPQLEGYALSQHDSEQFRGMANEAAHHRELHGEEPLWTNSMFGGMPLTQISVLHWGNIFQLGTQAMYKMIPAPMGVVLWHLLSFYFMGILLRLRPLTSLLGAIAFSFASYEIIILQAGHVSKAIATAFIPLVFGTFIYAYRKRSFLSIGLAGLAMALELTANHVQVTYYFSFLLLFTGIYLLVDSIQKKTVPSFLKTTAALLSVYVLAGIIVGSNLLMTMDYAKHTIRGENDVSIEPNGTLSKVQSNGLDKDYITNWSYGIGETATLISPNVKGGGSFQIEGSQFESIVENSDFNRDEKKQLLNLPAYWGDQPFTSGPVYIGIISVLLAFLGLIFLKTRMKWALFAATILAIVLSWGKNYMGFTEFFIDYVPGYDKFRTVTIILVIVEFCVPALGIFFLDLLIKERERFKEGKGKVLIAGGVFITLLLILRLVGLGDSYTSTSDERQLAQIEQSISNQILSMDKNVLKKQYRIDPNNPQSVQKFIDVQLEGYEDNFMNLRSIRKEIFNQSMNRSIAFAFVGMIVIALFLFTSIPSMALSGALLLLVLIDVVPVANDYLGKQEQGNGYKYWIEKSENLYPIAASEADEQILQNELLENPQLKSIIDKAVKEAKQKADDLDLNSVARRNFINSHKFSALNYATNYRVFDLSGSFQSSKASYLHKSLGGYHGAKLRNINNLMNFHLSNMNNNVYDMMNVKYFIQNGKMRVNPTKMGVAWLVRDIHSYETPDEEIVALGTQFEVENKGPGSLVVNGESIKSKMISGREYIQYVDSKGDSILVRMPNGLSEGMIAYFVQDANGQTNFVPQTVIENDSVANSFSQLIKVNVKETFDPGEEAVMLTSEASKLSQKKFSGEGSVTMKKYKPNQIDYEVKAKGKQFVVFSEVYYPENWIATIDGKEVDIIKTNYLLRGIEVPNGKHNITFKYVDKTFKLVNTIAFIASILLLLLIVFGTYRFVKGNGRS